MSYANAEIDFSGIHVACLSGPNGAGKSTLLDAVTWAIWEEGRARTDELIKLGQEEMSCELDFYMEDNLYKVYRSRTKAFKNSQGKSNLEFQVFNPKEQIWMSLSKSATRQTQDLIINTLKMDYETFVNSVYLRQGKADEFTLKKPTDRKQILADIIGLEVYDKLCEAAKEKTKFIDQSVSIEKNLISTLQEKIVTEEETKLTLSKVQNDLHEEELKANALTSELSIKEKELSEKKEKEKQINALIKSKETQDALIKMLEEQLKNIKAREEKCQQLIVRKNQIKDEYSKYQDLKKELSFVEEKKEKSEVLSGKKNLLEIKIKEKINEIEQQLAIYKSKINDRAQLKADLGKKLENENRFFDQFLPRVQDEIKRFYILKDLLLKIEIEGQEIKHAKELAEVSLKQVRGKIKDINQKIDTLNSHSHSEPCPLCQSPIQDKSKVIESYESENRSLSKEEELLIETLNLKEAGLINKRQEYNKIKEEINGFCDNLFKYLEELEDIKQEKLGIRFLEKGDGAKTLSFFESQLEVSRNEFQKAKETVAVIDNEINKFNLEINSLNMLLINGEHIKGISNELNLISKELSIIDYNSKTYDNLRKSIKEKEEITLTYNLLIQAESDIVNLNIESGTLFEKIKTSIHELSELDILINENKKEIIDIDLIQKKAIALKEELGSIDNTLNNLKRSLIFAEKNLHDIEDAKLLVKNKEDKIRDFVIDKKYYDVLEKAFSKNGIQVAIIETIVPEIEKEANRILNKLTDNQMHIALKTQRERKAASGLIETLDVVIADSSGTRNYELYSGGEAFKINFALRLALSRLLTNRANAKLKTLVIDEGFGSQDNAGRERLIEVIKSIQDEFELILVVTHIDELKESFPAHIQVSKDENVSIIQMLT